MGRISKPQKSKKNKKIKAIDPFYAGDRKGRSLQGLDQKPQSMNQEVPRKLQRLGYIMDSVKLDQTAKKSKNKFLAQSETSPVKYHQVFPSPMGEDTASGEHLKKSKKRFARKIKDDPTLHQDEESKKKQKKKNKSRLKTEDVEEYIDNLHATRPYMNVKFKQKKEESDKNFMRRVETEASSVLMTAKMTAKFEISDEKKIALMAKAKKSKLTEKKKQRLSDKKKKKVEAIKEKKREKLSDFRSLQDKVEFGEVVHAPPSLTSLPKKAKPVENDKPGLRMPELSEAINRNIQEASAMKTGNNPRPLTPRAVGQTRKRKHMSTLQQRAEDLRREDAVEAYRKLKKSKSKLKSV